MRTNSLLNRSDHMHCYIPIQSSHWKRLLHRKASYMYSKTRLEEGATENTSVTATAPRRDKMGGDVYRSPHFTTAHSSSHTNFEYSQLSRMTGQPVCQFEDRLSAGLAAAQQTAQGHTHDGSEGHEHSHDHGLSHDGINEHGHTHEHLEDAGESDDTSFKGRLELISPKASLRRETCLISRVEIGTRELSPSVLEGEYICAAGCS